MKIASMRFNLYADQRSDELILHFMEKMTGTVPKLIFCPDGSYIGSIAGDFILNHVLRFRCVKDSSNPTSVAELIAPENGGTLMR